MRPITRISFSLRWNLHPGSFSLVSTTVVMVVLTYLSYLVKTSSLFSHSFSPLVGESEHRSCRTSVTTPLRLCVTTTTLTTWALLLFALMRWSFASCLAFGPATPLHVKHSHYFIATTNTGNKAKQGQQPPVMRIGCSDLQRC